MGVLMFLIGIIGIIAGIVELIKAKRRGAPEKAAKIITYACIGLTVVGIAVTPNTGNANSSAKASPSFSSSIVNKASSVSSASSSSSVTGSSKAAGISSSTPSSKVSPASKSSQPSSISKPVTSSKTSSSSSDSAAKTSKSESSASEKTTSAYIINTKSKTFHLPSCGDVKKIGSGNKKAVTESRESLIAENYKPCKHCNPW